MKKLLFLISLTASIGAMAGTTDCSSFDSKLNYHSDSPDGGAPRGDVETLALGDQTLISRSFPGGASIVLASIEFGAVPVWSSKPVVKGDYRTIRSLIRLIVKKNSNGSTVFDDTVYCQTEKYVGRPRPVPNLQ